MDRIRPHPRILSLSVVAAAAVDCASEASSDSATTSRRIAVSLFTFQCVPFAVPCARTPYRRDPEPPFMAPPWKPSFRSASRPCFAPCRVRVDPLIIFMPSFWNVVAGITSPASTAEIGSSPAMEGSPAGLCSRRGSPAHTHLHRRISNQRSRLRTPSLLSGRSTADRRPGLPRQFSASTASWCTAPITSCRVSPSQRRSQPAVKAIDVLQKSPHVFQ